LVIGFVLMMGLFSLKTLAALVEPLKLTVVSAPEAEASWQGEAIHKIVSDSRKAAPNTVFVALIGTHSDGHDYIDQAIGKGCSAVVVQVGHELNSATLTHYTGLVLEASNTYQAFAELSSQLYNEPGKQLRMVGVTGTNGKTTVTHLIQRILNEAGDSAGLIGTLGSKTTSNQDNGYQASGHTTPMADELQSRLAAMRSEGLRSVVMEVSSHALEQFRVAGCDFQVAVITNLTQDHLDYHKTMDRYFEAKALLFRRLNVVSAPPKHAVINLDDAYGHRFAKAVPDGVTVWSYGLRHELATVRATDINYDISGASYTVHTPQGQAKVRLMMAGEFSVYNSLAALASGLALGIPLERCVQALESTPSVRGRFEVVARQPYVIVDYAHTPDGLDNVLRAARKVTPDTGKLWVVFGCGGDRDATKRPQMGRIAETLADRLVVTSDNPRTEDPQQILTDVLAGIERFDSARMQVEPDRRSAIRQALDGAQPDDVVVIAGKGHEDYQILKHETIHFDDREEVQTYLKRPATVSPPTQPTV
jgi:UDP-N-acetylmuramoyl-L-alanyl-D-glutamate--2,6-diaminopimelate ligase